MLSLLFGPKGNLPDLKPKTRPTFSSSFLWGCGTNALRKFNKTGKDIANVLEKVGITANKNTVPNDPQSPFVTSGVRLGAAAVTTRGFKEEDMVEVAKIIAGAVVASDNEVALQNLRERSLKLCKKYPLYEGMHV